MYYFASDIHLGLDAANSSAQREQLFVGWLEQVSADAGAIFLVGDIFDFWFEFGRVVPKGFTRTLGKLSELCDRGVEIHFFTGNHDIWAYDYLQTECGVILHHKPATFDLCGKEVFIAHGDTTCLKKPFKDRILQTLFRSKAMQWTAGRLVHPDLLMKLGLRWSARSRMSHHGEYRFGGEQEYLVQYTEWYSRRIAPEHIDYFIFGHIHYADIYRTASGDTIVWLGEWLAHPIYAVMREDRTMELKNYPLPSSSTI